MLKAALASPSTPAARRNPPKRNPGCARRQAGFRSPDAIRVRSGAGALDIHLRGYDEWGTGDCRCRQDSPI